LGWGICLGAHDSRRICELNFDRDYAPTALIMPAAEEDDLAITNRRLWLDFSP
jgi:hypothetical protein